jgi:hypothetical protein
VMVPTIDLLLDFCGFSHASFQQGRWFIDNWHCTFFSSLWVHMMFLCELFQNLVVKGNTFLLNIILIFFLCFAFSSLEWCFEWFLCAMCRMDINLYNFT